MKLFTQILAGIALIVLLPLAAQAAEGDIIWSKTLNPSNSSVNGNSAEYIFHMDVDSSGAYYVGHDKSNGGQLRIIKVNLSNGNIIWQQTQNLTSGNDAATSIAVDGTGVYITANNNLDSSSKWTVQKRSLTNGNIIWSKDFTPNGNTATNRPSAIALYGGAVYVQGTISNYSQWVMMKLMASNGNLAWQQTSNPSSSRDQGNAIAVDGTGVYFGGAQNYYESIRIEKRNLSNGNLQWATTESPGAGINQITSLSVSGSGLYLTGTQSGAGNANWGFLMERRNTANGSLVWKKTDNPTSGNDFAFDGVLDSTGFYVAGWDGAGSTYQRIQKRNLSNGNMIWEKTDHGAAGSDYVQAIAVQGDAIYTGGASTDSNSWVYEKRSNVADIVNFSSTVVPTHTGTLQAGQSVTFTGIVKNTGNMTVNTNFANKFEYRWGTSGGWTQLSQAGRTNNMTPNETITDVSSSFALTQTGTLQIRHCVDSNSNIAEADESVADNCKSGNFTIAPAPVTNFSSVITPTYTGTLQQGQTVRFTGRVQNTGNVTVNTNFSDRFEYRWGTSGGWSALTGHIDRTNNMTPNETIDDTTGNVTLSQSGTLQVRHCVDSRNNIAESNESTADNCKQRNLTVAALYSLNVSKAGSGNGTVSSNPSGINCGGSCSAQYTGGTNVTLTANPSASANFIGWSGAGCASAGAGACVVSMNSAQTVSARFMQPTATLSVTGCTVPTDQDSCITGRVTWSISDGAPAYSTRNETNGVVCGTTVSGTNVPCELNYGNNLIRVSDRTGSLRTATVASACGAGDIWDYTLTTPLCKRIPPPPSITITAQPQLVRSGDTATIPVQINSTLVLNCAVYGVENGPDTFVHNGASTPSRTYTFETNPLFAAQDVLVKCDYAPLQTISRTARVNVEPKVEEI